MNLINTLKHVALTLLLSVAINPNLNAQPQEHSTQKEHIKSSSHTLNTALKDSIDQIFSEWNLPNTPGCGLGIIKNGELIYAKGYGFANLEYDIPNSEHSVFRIGSTSKQFTAASIILLAEQKKLDLNHTLHQYFPEFPDYAKEITIRHLLNHTSGLRDYLTLSYLKGLGNNDYYTDRDILNWLSNQTSLNFKPGEEFLYSNSGYWLLGQIVNKVAEMNMAKFAEQEIFEPLGMFDTHFHNDHNQIVKNRASGYYPTSDSTYEIDMTTLDMIGDGGIFTTITDIKKWDDAYYNSTILSKAFWAMMTKKGVLNNGKKINYASGLFIETYKGLENINHGGAFVGFRSEFIRFPKQHVSIAIFANRGDANPTKKAYQIADILLHDEFKIEKETTTPKKTVKSTLPKIEFTLKQIEGQYEIEPGALLSLSVKDNMLIVKQNWNNAEYTIKRGSGNTFNVPTIEGIEFIFSKLEDNKTQHLLVIQGGQESSCKRKDTSAIASINLKDYVGQFYSKELDVTYSVQVEDNVLKVSMKTNPYFTISAINTDEFSFYGNMIHFKRTNNNVSGFELDAGRVKGLKFKKQ